MEAFVYQVEELAAFLRGAPFIILLLGTGIYLTFRLGGVQFRAARHAWKVVFRKGEGNKGDVTGYEALSTVLAGTIGTGNIAGVATALVAGGPGAIFWMWITVLFGMSLKFASCTLSHCYREMSKDGQMAGGPMYTLKNGLNMPKLGAAFAIFVLLAGFTTGGLVQSHSVISGFVYIIPAAEEHSLLMGFIIAGLVGLVTLGGVKRIAKVASVVVPFMAVLYCAAAVLILILNIDEVPKAFSTIFIAAFNPEAVGGAAIGLAIQYGVVRALFASETGLGTAPIGLAATKSDEPVQVGLIGMVGPWVDTLTICTLTALVIIISGGWGDTLPDGLSGAALSAYAFESGLASLGPVASTLGAWVVGFGLVFFAYTTMLAWAYYSDKSAQFLFGEKVIKPFRFLFLAVLVLGSVGEIGLVWNIADIANVLMAVPNLISLILLAGVVKKLSDDYFLRLGGYTSKESMQMKAAMSEQD